MQQMQAAWLNVLESATVTLTSESADAPAYRLFDRIFGRPWTAVNTATQTIKINQAAPVPVNRLIVPPGHNLSGATLSWQGSATDSGYSDLVAPWVQPDNGLIIKTAVTSAAWQKFIIASPQAPPQVGELFLTNLVTFKGPDFGSRAGKKADVSRVQLRGGAPSFVKWGSARQVLTYEIPSGAAADRSIFEAWFDAWDGCKPFFLIDHQGNSFFAELLDPPEFIEKDVNSFALSLRMQQVF